VQKNKGEKKAGVITTRHSDTEEGEGLDYNFKTGERRELGEE